MIRLVVIGLIVLAVWVLLMKLLKEIRGANVDWTGVAFFTGFVVMAFWLRHLTGLG